MLHLEMVQPLSLLSSNQDHPETNNIQVTLVSLHTTDFSGVTLIMIEESGVVASNSIVACQRFTCALCETFHSTLTTLYFHATNCHIIVLVKITVSF
jgi:hypothetical protein